MDDLRLKYILQKCLLAVTMAGAWTAVSVAAQPLLRCDVRYAGTTHVVEAKPVRDPYSVPSVDIGGRFFFKAIMVGTLEKIDYIKLYAYLDTARQPVLVQQVTYLPPFPRGPEISSLTGEQHLFAGPAERELLYQCTLQEAAP